MTQNYLGAIGLFHLISHFRILYLSVHLDKLKLKKTIPPSTSNVSKFPSWQITKTARGPLPHPQTPNLPSPLRACTHQSRLEGRLGRGLWVMARERWPQRPTSQHSRPSRLWFQCSAHQKAKSTSLFFESRLGQDFFGQKGIRRQWLKQRLEKRLHIKLCLLVEVGTEATTGRSSLD